MKAIECQWQSTQNALSCHSDAFIVFEVSANKRYQPQIQFVHSQQPSGQTEMEKKRFEFLSMRTFRILEQIACIRSPPMSV